VSEKILVVGAGLSGMAAASYLAQHGFSVQLIEGRNRLGGRAFSFHSEGVPVDLGPEFFHGHAPELRALVGPSRFVEPEESETFFWQGRIEKKPDFFEQLAEWSKELKKSDPDQPVAEALDRLNLNKLERAQFTSYLEGFNAMDILLASQSGLVQEMSHADGDQAARPLGGFSEVVDLAASHLSGVQVHLNEKVRSIHWRPGHVSVRTEEAFFEGHRLVLTVPPSVFHLIEITPPLPSKKQAASLLPLGAVQKVVMELSEPLWDSNGAGLAFLHAPEKTFGAHWMWAVHERPILSCWSGGPRAMRLNRLSREDIVLRAQLDLSEILGISLTALKEKVMRAHFHDWVDDPFARGAYSYVKLGGSNARQNWAEPVQGTLFFAGEATCNDGSSGTGHGALRSGLRAAREVIAVPR
jgi:monoamine oxidase